MASASPAAVPKIPPDTPTGTLLRYIPAGPKRDELLGLVRVGIRFTEQQRGRRPGFLHRYIVGIVGGIARPCTFDALLVALELEAMRRAEDGGVPTEHVSRAFELLTYHDPKKGRLQVTFGRLRNILTDAKRENSRLPLNRESTSIEFGHAARLRGSPDKDPVP